MLAMGHRPASDSFSFVVFVFSLSLPLSLSLFLFQKSGLDCSNVYVIIGLEQQYWCLAVQCARPSAHLLFNELVCFCRSVANNPLLDCTPPNNAEFLTGPPICLAPFPPSFSPPPSPPPPSPLSPPPSFPPSPPPPLPPLSSLPPPSFTAPPSPAFILGDASGDGIVSVPDVVLIVAFVAGNTPFPGPFAAADINGDGVISVLVSQSLQDFADVFFPLPPLFGALNSPHSYPPVALLFVMACRIFCSLSTHCSNLASRMSAQGFSLFQLFRLLFIESVLEFLYIFFFFFQAL